MTGKILPSLSLLVAYTCLGLGQFFHNSAQYKSYTEPFQIMISKKEYNKFSICQEYLAKLWILFLPRFSYVYFRIWMISHILFHQQSAELFCWYYFAVNYGRQTTQSITIFHFQIRHLLSRNE